MSLKARIATPFRVSLPVLRRLLAESALLIPSGGIVGAAVLWGAAQLMVGRWADAGVGALGGWSLTALYAVVGGAGGALAGAIAACARTLAYVEHHTEAWILDLPTDWGRDLLPSVPLDELEGRSGGILDRVADATLARLPMPRFVRRFATARMRQALLGDFVAMYRDRGVTVVGHGELRNWLLIRGLTHAIEPARAQLALWRALTLAALGSAVLIALAIAALGGVLRPVAIALTVFALAGAGIIAWGLPRAPRRERPERWRAGIVILGVCVAGWPAVYAWLWPREPGLAWLAVLALTYVTVRRGFEEAFIRAGAATGPETRIPPERAELPVTGRS